MKNRVHNIPAIIVCTLLSMAIPALWYMIFSKPWMAANHLELVDIENGHSTYPYIIAAISSFVGAYVLSWLNINLGGDNFLKGMGIALLAGLTFCFLPLATQNAFSFQSNVLTFIDGGVNLINWMLVGGILGAWKKYRSE